MVALSPLVAITPQPGLERSTATESRDGALSNLKQHPVKLKELLGRRAEPKSKYRWRIIARAVRRGASGLRRLL
jgi:hypothetical protein